MIRQPPLWRKVAIVVAEQLYCLWLLIAGAYPFICDLLATAVYGKSAHIPNTIAEMMDAGVMSRLTGFDVVRVERGKSLDQHANSTDRDWLKLTMRDGSETNVFAKTPARNSVVWSMMCIFDVYRNELHAYRSLQLNVTTPKVHSALWSHSRFSIVMEDLSRQGVDFPNIWREPGCTKAQAKSVLSMYAKLHAQFLGAAPAGVWDDERRPYFGKVVGLVTLRRFVASLPDVIPQSVLEAYTGALWRFDDLRRLWSAAEPKTMVHGDAHFGNLYFLPSGEVGIIDLQCVAEEHPMRDITYFLASGYPADALERDEKELIRHYLSELSARLKERDPSGGLRAPSFENAWEQYHLQSFYAMYAFVFSGGLGHGLMDDHQGRVGVTRIARMMQRIDAASALEKALAQLR